MSRGEGTGVRRTLRIARGAAKVMSILVALGAVGVLVSVSARPQTLTDPSRFVAIGANAGELFRLAVLLGVCGGALAFGVLVLAIRGLFWRSGPKRMDRLMVVGMVAVVAFGAGGLALAAMGPSFIRAFPDAPSVQAQDAVLHNTSLLFGLSVGVAWQMIGALAASMWWFFLVRLLPSSERATRFVGFGIAGLGGVCVVARAVSLDAVADVAFALAVMLVIASGFVLQGTLGRISDVLDEAGVTDDDADDGAEVDTEDDEEEGETV